MGVLAGVLVFEVLLLPLFMFMRLLLRKAARGRGGMRVVRGVWRCRCEAPVIAMRRSFCGVVSCSEADKPKGVRDREEERSGCSLTVAVLAAAAGSEAGSSPDRSEKKEGILEGVRHIDMMIKHCKGVKLERKDTEREGR